MADVKISELPAASALVAGDLFPAVQDDSGLVTRKATAAQIGAYVRGLAGSVLQVVHVETTTETTITSGTFTATGLSATITPSSSSSRVLVIVNQSLETGRNNLGCGSLTRLVRGATEIFAGVRHGVVAAGVTSTEWRGQVGFSVVDAPSTTSALTYATQGRPEVTDDASFARYQPGSSRSSMTLMEIA